MEAAGFHGGQSDLELVIGLRVGRLGSWGRGIGLEVVLSMVQGGDRFTVSVYLAWS